MSVRGYVLGAEVQTHKHGYYLWVLAIGDTPTVADSAAERLIFPEVDHRIRVLEDGYNATVIARCHALFLTARSR